MKKLLTFVILLLGVMTINAQTYLEENFDLGIPGDWTQVTNATDGGWIAGTSAQLSSGSYPIADNGPGQMIGTNDDACNCDKMSDRIIMPAIDLSAAPTAVIKFDAHYQGLTYQGATETLWLDVSIDGGTTWDVIQELPTVDGWNNNVLIDLSTYIGNAAVMISFRYSDAGGWTYGAALDNISVFSPAAYDIKADRLTTTRFQLSGEMVDITAEVTNFGANELTSFDFSYTDGTTVASEMITGLSIPFGQTETITHPTQYLVSDAVSYDITVSAFNPNNSGQDADSTNNITAGIVSGVTYVPGKKMLVEEATGTWCGWCPRGWEWMDFMAENYPEDFVGIAVHNSDPMELAAYDDGLTSFPGFSGFPSVIVDRTYITDPSQIENDMPASLAKIAPVAPSVTATMDVVAMTIDIDGSAEFVTQLDDIDYRLNLVLSENTVTGTGSGWDQVNYYSGGNPDPIPGFGIDWNAAPDPVPGSELEYNHVGRWLSDGWDGAAGSVPSSVVAGDMATHSYSGAFNMGWNPFNMEAVVMVLDNETGVALNINADHVEVICPADIEETIEVTDTPEGMLEGEILVTMANANLGFGGYTYSVDSGVTSAEVGTPLTGLGAGTYTVIVTDAIGCADEFEVTVAGIVAVHDIDALTSMSLFPNPTSNTSVLNATFNENVDLKISVISNIGQIVEAVQFDNVNHVNHDINVSDLPAGLYLVKLNVNDQVRTHRLMVR